MSKNEMTDLRLYYGLQEEHPISRHDLLPEDADPDSEQYRRVEEAEAELTAITTSHLLKMLAPDVEISAPDLVPSCDLHEAVCKIVHEFREAGVDLDDLNGQADSFVSALSQIAVAAGLEVAAAIRKAVVTEKEVVSGELQALFDGLPVIQLGGRRNEDHEPRPQTEQEVETV